MDSINWLLVNLGEAFRWSYDAVTDLLIQVGGGLADLLNPVLSPLLAVVNPPATKVGDAVYVVLSPFPVWVGLTVLSVLTGGLALLAFRYTSNQAAISRVKDEIKANILSIKLYKDEIRVTLGAQVRILWALVKLQRYTLPPVLVLLPPMLLCLGQMGVRYQWRAVLPGEQVLVRMRLRDGDRQPSRIELEPTPGLVVEVGPVAGDNDIVWRVRGASEGRHLLKFRVDGAVLSKEFVVGSSFQRVSARRSDGQWTSQLLHPTESRLPEDVPVSAIEIDYPGVESWVYGEDYWVLYFFIVSMAAALPLRPIFGVTF